MYSIVALRLTLKNFNVLLTSNNNQYFLPVLYILNTIKYTST